MSKAALTILGLLAERPMHGYELLHMFNERYMHTWLRISSASIYNTLNKLSEDGSIEVKIEKIGKNPERHVYKLNEKGKKQLGKLVEKQLRTITHTDYPFGLGVAFLPYADRKRVIRILRERLKEMENFEEKIAQSFEENKERIPYNWLALIRVGKGHHEAEIDQIKFLLENLEKKNS